MSLDILYETVENGEMSQVAIVLPKIKGYKDVGFKVPGYRAYRDPNNLLKVLNKNLEDEETASRFVLERERWRAELGGMYAYIDMLGNESSTIDNREYVNNAAWECGNYFRNELEARKAASQIKELLDEIHKITG